MAGSGRTTFLAILLIFGVPALAPEALASPYSIEVAAAGQSVVLYAEETGEGPPLLLLHGLGASTFTWRHVVPALARDHRVIALDLKGFGRSDKPLDYRYSAADQAELVAAFIAERGLTGVTLIGHSFGGTVALLTALRFAQQPGRIHRLVVIDAPALEQDFPGAAELVRAPAIPYVAMTLSPPEVLARVMLRIVRAPGRAVPEADIRGYAAPYYTRGSRHAFMATVQAILDGNTPRMGARYRYVTQPTLVVWCRRDRIVPLATGRRLVRILPNAQLATLGRCNHLPQDEVPGALLAKLRPFLRA
ncbi:MAG: alpha/beta hydrolase [Hyphomicrobium sp.]|uniref:alpha/beta fold hydrolase n=1 Tax=Hyphomicrobium sp. TaxID=82 RepID=UPI0025BD46D7|nr:alpha/beta hydrolase [Hyphomicrobium sp.]MBZ0209156.1 alpha/beta hydrolase [Hyphomicrobium sp.]